MSPSSLIPAIWASSSSSITGRGSTTRRQDAGEDVGHIPAPPTYSQADTRKATWWKHRGKLDVPKERFILYPDAGREGDPTLLLGWASWDHAQQALALNRIVDERLAEDAPAERLGPLGAGLAELEPWLEQWHAEEDPAFGLPLKNPLAVDAEEEITVRQI